MICCMMRWGRDFGGGGCRGFCPQQKSTITQGCGRYHQRAPKSWEATAPDSTSPYQGEQSFFLQPGEKLERGIQNVYVLSEQQGLLLRALQPLEEGEGKEKVSHQAGDHWLIRGPLEYVPPAKVEVVEERQAIPLDENEGIYVQDVKTGRVTVEGWALSLPGGCGGGWSGRGDDADGAVGSGGDRRAPQRCWQHLSQLAAKDQGVFWSSCLPFALNGG